MRKKPDSAAPESPEAIAAVDDILAGVGLQHGTRSSRAGAWHNGLRVARSPAPLPKTATTPSLIRIPSLSQAEGLVHGFSTRVGGVSRCYRTALPTAGGDLNLGFTKHDDAENVRANRRLFLEALDAASFKRFAVLRQLHTPAIRVLRIYDEAAPDFTQPGTMRADALMTDQPGVLLTIQAADCVPVLLFDPVQRAIAAFHAGWRGTLARIVERGVGTMRALYGSHPADLLAAIGPSIGPATYSVGEDVRHDFVSQFTYADELFHEVYDSDPIREKYPLLFLTARAPGHSPTGPQLHLDLWAANRRQLLDGGLLESHITTTGHDTAANTHLFFSHRAEQGFTGRMMAAIGMRG